MPRRPPRGAGRTRANGGGPAARAMPRLRSMGPRAPPADPRPAAAHRLADGRTPRPPPPAGGRGRGASMKARRRYRPNTPPGFCVICGEPTAIVRVPIERWRITCRLVCALALGALAPAAAEAQALAAGRGRCAICGEPTELVRGSRWRRTCDPECLEALRIDAAGRPSCGVCGRPVSRNSQGRWGRTCSPECARRRAR